MLVTITSIELKSPWKFFPLTKNAMKIIRQLKSTNNKAYRSTGFWTKHYTMTLWENEQEIKDFYRNGAHKDAMKISSKIAKEIRTYTYNAEALPNWNDAKSMLADHGKALNF